MRSQSLAHAGQYPSLEMGRERGSDVQSGSLGLVLEVASEEGKEIVHLRLEFLECKQISFREGAVERWQQLPSWRRGPQQCRQACSTHSSSGWQPQKSTCCRKPGEVRSGSVGRIAGLQATATTENGWGDTHKRRLRLSMLSPAGWYVQTSHLVFLFAKVDNSCHIGGAGELG